MNKQAVLRNPEVEKEEGIGRIGLRYIAGEKVTKELVTSVDVFSVSEAISGAIR
jgi:hypothetical protein